MADKNALSWPNFAVSILGGVAAAVIFAVVARGGFGGLLLAHLAPLPIMIVAFAFGLIHGATAAILASIILIFWPHPVIGMGYALLIAAPAWSAVYAALGAPRGGRDRLTRNLPGWAALAPATFLASGDHSLADRRHSRVRIARRSAESDPGARLHPARHYGQRARPWR